MSQPLAAAIIDTRTEPWGDVRELQAEVKVRPSRASGWRNQRRTAPRNHGSLASVYAEKAPGRHARFSREDRPDMSPAAHTRAVIHQPPGPTPTYPTTGLDARPPGHVRKGATQRSI